MLVSGKAIHLRLEHLNSIWCTPESEKGSEGISEYARKLMLAPKNLTECTGCDF